MTERTLEPAPPSRTTCEEMARTLRMVAQGWPAKGVTHQRLQELVGVLAVIATCYPAVQVDQLPEHLQTALGA